MKVLAGVSRCLHHICGLFGASGGVWLEGWKMQHVLAVSAPTAPKGTRETRGCWSANLSNTDPAHALVAACGQLCMAGGDRINMHTCPCPWWKSWWPLFHGGPPHSSTQQLMQPPCRLAFTAVSSQPPHIPCVYCLLLCVQCCSTRMACPAATSGVAVLHYFPTRGRAEPIR
jgi:hypothetical protein